MAPAQSLQSAYCQNLRAPDFRDHDDKLIDGLWEPFRRDKCLRGCISQAVCRGSLYLLRDPRAKCIIHCIFQGKCRGFCPVEACVLLEAKREPFELSTFTDATVLLVHDLLLMLSLSLGYSGNQPPLPPTPQAPSSWPTKLLPTLPLYWQLHERERPGKECTPVSLIFATPAYAHRLG